MAYSNKAVTLPIIPAAAPVVATGGLIPALETRRAISGGAAVVYGVNKQARRADNTKHVEFQGDGATVAWDSDDFANLANADVQTAVGLDAANCLRVVVTVSGTPLLREGSDETPIAGEFKIAESGGTYTLTFGAAPADGALVEVHLADAADIATADALTADLPANQLAYDFMGTATAAAVLY